jgi:putative endonuclease
MRVKDAVGAYGEHVAAQYLTRSGYIILARNWRCAEGEIDIVAMDGETVVVCEVKTRSGQGFGSGFDAVTREKAARVRSLGRRWLGEFARPDAPLRFDVIAVHRSRRGLGDVEHIRGAF